MEGTLSTGGSEVTFQDEEVTMVVREGNRDTIDSEYHGTERAFILFQKAGKVRTLVMGNLFYSD